MIMRGMRKADIAHRLASRVRHGPGTVPGRSGGEGRAGTGGLAPAAHRSIVCVDVEGFGDRRRTNADQVAVRDGLYGALREAFARSGVRWEDCYREDRGDGVLVLVPPQVPKTVLVARVPSLAKVMCSNSRR